MKKRVHRRGTELKTDKGTLFIFSGPSGTGKGTILSEFTKKYGEYNLKYSVSATTRNPRSGEKDGVNYYFKSKDEFLSMIDDDDFLEWSKFCDNYYGTPRDPVMKSLSDGYDIILEIETVGAANVKCKYPEAVSIFVLPPSLSELKKRLYGRGTEPDDIIKKRYDGAVNEIEKSYNYDFVIVNNNIDKAVEDFKSIIDSERLKAHVNKNTITEVLKR